MKTEIFVPNKENYEKCGALIVPIGETELLIYYGKSMAEDTLEIAGR